MKPDQNILGPLREYLFRQREFVRLAVKYDNRAFAARSLQFWAIAQNPPEKIATAEVEFPNNQASELLAEGYATAFER